MPTSAELGPLSVPERQLVDLINPAVLVELASQLIAQRSDAPAYGEQATVAVLQQFCQAAGLATEVTDAAEGRPNFTATLPAGEAPGVLFLGHSDVVPADGQWTTQPFTPSVRDGRLYGRGSADMKGGLAAVAVALAALQQAGIALRGPCQLHCVVDEENEGLGIQQVIARPAARSWQACIVAEPTDLQTVIAARGDVYVTAEVSGVAAHSGQPDNGRNAIDAAAQIIGVVADDYARLKKQAHSPWGSGSWSTGMIHGGDAGNIVARSCSVLFDRRLAPGENIDSIVQQLSEQVRAAGIDGDGIEVSFRVGSVMPPFVTPVDHPLVVAAVETLGNLSHHSETIVWSGGCDGGYIAEYWQVPTIVLGAGDLNGQAHKPDESIPIDQLVLAARAYALLVYRLLGS